MSLLHLAWRSLWQRPVVTLLTVLGVALGVALICSVLTLRRETERSFISESGLFDIVVGAKGSPLQVVLSSVYHLDIPTGNIPYERYEALRDHRDVRAAIPINLGDNYRGFRIVGTTDAMLDLTQRERGSGESVPFFRLAEGRRFVDDFEAVIGASVARQSGLQLGSTFSGTHGLVAVPGSEQHDEFPYTVVGILAPTGTSQDRAIFTTLASVWKVHDYEEQAHEALFAPRPTPTPAPEPTEGDEPRPRREFAFFAEQVTYADDDAREVTAVLVQLNSPGRRLWLADDISRNTESMAAIPMNELLRLYVNVLGPAQRTLLAVAWLVVAVSALSILTTLYQAAEHRRRSLAILRLLGAHRSEVFLLVLLEAALVTLLGIGVGWLLGHGGAAAAGRILADTSGLVIAAWSIDKQEIQALGTIAFVGLLSGLVPAILAYRRSPAHDL